MKRPGATPVTWTTVDALFFTSIVNRYWLPGDSPSRSMSPLAETIYLFDGLEKALPGLAEVQVAMHRLVHAGLVTVEGDAVHLTSAGLALAERAPVPDATWTHSGRRFINYPGMLWIEEQLASYPLVTGEWPLDPAVFTSAVREYRAWFRSEYRPMSGKDHEL